MRLFWASLRLAPTYLSVALSLSQYHDDTGAEKQIGIYPDTEATGLQ